MNKDNFYVFDKITKEGTLLGEIQSEFNISLTIDGTKDSCSVLVYSYNDYEIEPYTICWHEKTNTWWIVSHDKIERYYSENGFLYIHNLELLGAVELLNARDLTDCGFNNKTYTISQFTYRLIHLSNFEFQNAGIAFGVINGDMLVDFIKTFENYTLLSALREFYDAYNCAVKMYFSTDIQNNKIVLTNAVLQIVSKTGSNLLTSHNINDFEDARETKTMDKNSFGTCVVSNAENVISSKEKKYPSTGSARLSSTEITTTAANAVLRLPSKVFKGNWIKMIYAYGVGLAEEGYEQNMNSFTYQPYNSNSAQKFKEFIHTQIRGLGIQTQYEDEAIAYFDSIFDSVIEKMNKAGTITMYNGNKLVPTFSSNSSTVEIQKGDNVPYLAIITENDSGVSAQDRKMVFCDKETKELLPLKREGIAWERGSDLLTGFDFLGHNNKIKSFLYTDYQTDSDEFSPRYTIAGHTIYIKTFLGQPIISLPGSTIYGDISFIVNYIPMSDIKIKVDNQRTKKDIHLYNQNGKITDNFALSKLLNSYSKEISSDNVVRYMQYTDYDDVPKVGSLVNTTKGVYVINNISMTFTQNESSTHNDFGYYIECEINMSKAISTKSLMVNPNTNIRDYGIPQNYNIKRKQLYRDYYELNYGTNDDTETNYYLGADKIFNYPHDPNYLDNFIAVMKLTYLSQVEGQRNWYYQLETTNYFMNKMLYIIVDFNDNNIIGYGSQNVFSGFDIGRIFSGLTDTINTPISYVDDNGEVKGFDILFLNNEQITNIYQYYLEKWEHGNSDISLYNYSVFIPSDIYDDSITYETFEIRITEENYKKDALEVPVFEYVCQIDDSDDVLIGDSILIQRTGNIKYFYSFVKGQNLTQDNAVQTNRVREKMTSPLGWILSDGAEIEYERFSNTIRLLRIRIYNSQFYNLNDLEFHDQNQLDFEQGYDYAFFRHAYDFTTKEEIVDLLFIAKAVPSTHISNDGKILTLEINHYKLN